jgi:hypothetical protein
MFELPSALTFFWSIFFFIFKLFFLFFPQLLSAELDFGTILEANSHELESGGAKSRDIESGGCAARGRASACEAREKTRGKKQEGENKSKGENKSAVEKKAGVRERGNAEDSFLFTRDMCADCQRRQEEDEAEARRVEARLAAFRCASDVLKSQIFIGAGVGSSGPGCKASSCSFASAPPPPPPQEAAAAAAASPDMLPQVRAALCKTLGQCALRWPGYYLAAEWLGLISLNLEDTTPDTCHKVLGLRALLVQKYK